MRAYGRIVSRARTLRRSLSPAEVRLWVRLRKAREEGLAFRRQHPLGNYVLDFYCPRAKLAVEVDGWTHDDPEQAARDLERTRWLERQGVVVMRLSAGEVMRNADAAAESVWSLALERVAQLEGR